MAEKFCGRITGQDKFVVELMGLEVITTFVVGLLMLGYKKICGSLLGVMNYY